MPFVVPTAPTPNAVGVSGIEARHTWAGKLTLNDLTGPFPRYRVVPQGLYALGELEDIREGATGRRGEVPRPSFRRGKTVTYTGWVEALDLDSLRQAQAAVAAAFDVTEEQQMVIARDAALSNDVAFYWARCVMADPGVDDTQTVAETNTVPVHAAGGINRKIAAYVRPLTIALRLSDPRIYDAVQRQAVTGLLAQASGTAPPFIPPIVIAAPAPAGAVTFDVGGQAIDTDPIIDIYGPVTNPVIVSDTVGAQLRWRLELAAGSFLRLDFAARTATLNGVTDVMGRRDRSASTWWNRGVPGLLGAQQNTIRLRGDALADPAQARIAWYPVIG